ncbi:hypothetical protein I553_6720 [Mycobacterium xenopi 4042]|uniref:ER-bound oxygenase mpaB/mpaB'/Rubber oxygenase catalytic domain-containing protein n=1 Tax=Mycobacterium xenopi 4042 TaxID=1299334 RepID=X8DEK4_MYCXE|nr:hypothetical protein I553_6720 [Mycobacterium xenopi 4042]
MLSTLSCVVPGSGGRHDRHTNDVGQTLPRDFEGDPGGQPAPATATPLGPDSLTWKYFGDLRTGMMGVWIGAIQNMYPELGAGVEEHSILLREPLQRVARSVYPIMGVVYDGDRAAHTAQQIKDYHRTIKGVDANGRRYHALNPETFYWAHATFFMLVIKVAEYFCGGLTEAEKRQLFDEHVQWYRMYGMSMRPVPKSWEEFQEYWDRVCRERLELNPATRDIFQMRIPKPKFVPMPTPLWDQLFKPWMAGQRWIAAGLFDPRCARRRNALDTGRRGVVAAVRQVRGAGVFGGARRDTVTPAGAGRLPACARPDSPRCTAGGSTAVHGAAA